jgi:hypothetical protein
MFVPKNCTTRGLEMNFADDSGMSNLGWFGLSVQLLPINLKGALHDSLGTTLVLHFRKYTIV